MAAYEQLEEGRRREAADKVLEQLMELCRDPKQREQARGVVLVRVAAHFGINVSNLL